MTDIPQHKKAPTDIRPSQKPTWSSFLPVLACFGVTALVMLVFFRSVDLKPRVGENFFFSKNDPQVRADNEISRTFPEMTEIDLTVSGDIASRW